MRDVVSIFAPFFPGMAGRQPISGFIEQFADQRAAAPGYPSLAGRGGGTELLLDLVPSGAIEDAGTLIAYYRYRAFQPRTPTKTA